MSSPFPVVIGRIAWPLIDFDRVRYCRPVDRLQRSAEGHLHVTDRVDRLASADRSVDALLVDRVRRGSDIVVVAAAVDQRFDGGDDGTDNRSPTTATRSISRIASASQDDLLRRDVRQPRRQLLPVLRHREEVPTRAGRSGEEMSAGRLPREATVRRRWRKERPSVAGTRRPPAVSRLGHAGASLLLLLLLP